MWGTFFEYTLDHAYKQLYLANIIVSQVIFGMLVDKNISMSLLTCNIGYSGEV
jgi:hypothetical protein